MRIRTKRLLDLLILLSLFAILQYIFFDITKMKGHYRESG